jgi:hypothetical protein
MSTHEEQIAAGIEYAKKNERPVVGGLVGHIDHERTGELMSITEGIGEVWIPANGFGGEETYYEKIEEIFDPNVVLTAAKNVKFGFPIGNDGTTITGI